MKMHLTQRALKALAIAADEARSFNHEYVGTEHVLLGLVAEPSGVARDVLAAMGVDVAQIRGEIERLAQRGSEPASAGALPHTPRTKQVIDYAREEAQSVGQKVVDAEHLLIALLREPDGVAGVVLKNLGVKANQLRAEALRTRIELMKIVERSVRPVPSSTPRKRKMREELLAHLSTIYEEELARSGQPAFAFKEAARRFGAPGELAQEFQASLPIHERISNFMERFVAYRAPESAGRYSLRLAWHTFALLAVLLAIVTGGIALRYGWTDDLKTLARVLGAIAVLTPPAQFVIGLAYIKLRDAMWGAFGSRKSRGRVLVLAVLIAAVAQLYLMGIAAVIRMDLSTALDAARFGAVIAVISAVAFAVLAYIGGHREIRDTQWALLEIEAA
jgi:Clp amino terminal domain, pathogenicity island component